MANAMNNIPISNKNSLNKEEKLTFSGKNTAEGRPIYKNQYGDWVTERTITEEIPELGGFVNIPTVLDGRFLTTEQAIDMAKRTKGYDAITGRKLDVYKDVNEAVNSAVNRSKLLGQHIDYLFKGNN